jgi:cellobiose-specific phosphotransferase system component IIB
MFFLSSNDILISLQSKLEYPGTKERAMVWYPKAEKIQQLSKDAYDYIENLKIAVDKLSKNKIDENVAKKAFEKLVSYQRDILLVDPKIAYEFQKALKIFTKEIDSLKSNQKNLFQNYFNNTSKISAIAMLNKLQNNIRINEEKILVFCHEQIGSVGRPHTFISAISVQSSSIVQPGQRIEILTGIGEFNMDYSPEVFVYGKLVSMDANAIAVYKLKAASKPGKYYVPIKINYIDQNGMAVSVEKEIEYTVASVQQQ